MNRETILQIAVECGFTELNPMGFFWTKEREAIVERFAHRMMAEGVKMANDRFVDAWDVKAKLREFAEQLEKGE